MEVFAEEFVEDFVEVLADAFGGASAAGWVPDLATVAGDFAAGDVASFADPGAGGVAATGTAGFFAGTSVGDETAPGMPREGPACAWLPALATCWAAARGGDGSSTCTATATAAATEGMRKVGIDGGP